ncbi:hypothetical protein AMATHDRAFT_2877 [Amanita thiersii Skay4041]|uniref:Ammonia transport outward protein 2 n=1 Tax=Amanita thiersii Skay4041 TaxID=703135 RepID=A0A2A9NNB9_9AGAR|nr:hypothetical protein AMATHDRAFT_2877 [Amanita thiersii Skay4041]
MSEAIHRKGRFIARESAHVAIFQPDTGTFIDTPPFSPVEDDNQEEELVIANPYGLGLLGFSTSTFVASMYSMQCRGIKTPNVLVGVAIASGSIAQFLSGMWAFVSGDMLGGTAFISYGAYWLSYAAVLIPGTGILAAFENKPEELRNALGIYLAMWVIVTFLFLIAALRRSICLVMLLVLPICNVVSIIIGEFTNNTKYMKIGGGFGVAAAFVGYYMALRELLLSDERPLLRLPMWEFKND